MYRTKKFSVRKNVEDIKKDVHKAGKMFGNRVEKIFFEDGNAFVVKSSILIELTEYCYQQHPNLRKINSYAHVKDILKKSDDDLKKLDRLHLQHKSRFQLSESERRTGKR